MQGSCCYVSNGLRQDTVVPGKKMWIKKKSHIHVSCTLGKVYSLLWDVKAHGRYHREDMLA